jgi:hypothetical protein|tara:strand:+ start:59 stop:520 length:462 start_codon:yes stop_codon:yes gene_type:complete
MKKQILQERFQQLAGIKPLYENTQGGGISSMEYYKPFIQTLTNEDYRNILNSAVAYLDMDYDWSNTQGEGENTEVWNDRVHDWFPVDLGDTALGLFFYEEEEEWASVLYKRFSNWEVEGPDGGAEINDMFETMAENNHPLVGAINKEILRTLV